MTKKFENINSDDIKLKEDGSVELNEELQDEVAGGVDPESQEDEASQPDININCHC